MSTGEKLLAQGWACPRCGRINAPWKPSCNCPPRVEIRDSSTYPYEIRTSSATWVSPDITVIYCEDDDFDSLVAESLDVYKDIWENLATR